MRLERHSAAAPDRHQVVEIELEVTQRDIDNMSAIKNETPLFADLASKIYDGYDFALSNRWNLETLFEGDRFVFRVVNNELQHSKKPGHKEFLEYLKTYEIDSKLREEFGFKALASPMLYLPVTRSAQGLSTSVTLHSFNESEHKQMVDATTSKSPPHITGLAMGRVANKFHKMLHKDEGNARQRFRQDSNLVQFTNILKELGYDWDLDTSQSEKTQYDLTLMKQGVQFLASAASSGEKELLTYLLAVYGLDVKNTLIIVDEPELHLHPKWQRVLLNLFARLSKETGNQFLFSTHSPTFVSPASIQHVSRGVQRTAMQQDPTA